MNSNQTIYDRQINKNRIYSLSRATKNKEKTKRTINKRYITI